MKKILRVIQIAAILGLVLFVIAIAAEGPPVQGGSPSMQGGQGGMPGGGPGGAPGGMPGGGAGGPPGGMQRGTPIADITGETVKVDETCFKGKSSATEVSNFTISSDNKNVVGVNINAKEGADKIVVKNGRISLIDRPRPRK